MKCSLLRGWFLFFIPSSIFADGGVSGALGFIDSLLLITLIISTVIHAGIVYSLSKKKTFKRVESISISLLFSALTMMLWLIQFLNNIANKLNYSWPNYHEGVLLPVILTIILILIVWSAKVVLQQYLFSNDQAED